MQPLGQTGFPAVSGKKIAPSELVILHLLELINSEADNRAIELAVKRDAYGAGAWSGLEIPASH